MWFNRSTSVLCIAHLWRAIVCVAAMAAVVPAHAEDPSWTCSRSAPVGAPKSKDTMSFDLSESTTIEIALMDLFQIYSGGTVLMGSKPLSACYIENSKLTESAMREVDGDSSTLNELAASDGTTQSKILSVRSEEQMKMCIAKNHPAVGYLSGVVETDEIGPCF